MATVVIDNVDFIIFVKEIGRTTEFRERRQVEPEPKQSMANANIPPNNSHVTESKSLEDITPVQCPETEGVNIRILNANEGAAREEDDEELKVGETQPSRVEVEDDQKNENEAYVNVGPTDGQQLDSSPTKTVTLEDDRRTEDVIQEWGDELFQKPNSESDPLTQPTSPVCEMELENGSVDGLGKLSVPPGFDRIENPCLVEETNDESGKQLETQRIVRYEKKQGRKSTKRTSLKLNDRLKDKARRQRDAHKKKEGKQKRLREEEAAITDWSSEEEIDSSESDGDKVWNIGTKVGLCADSILKAQKYLKSAMETPQQKEQGQCSRRARRRDGYLKEFKWCIDKIVNSGEKIGKLLLKSKRADVYNGMRSLASGTHDESSNTLVRLGVKL
ncbi:hypothetical protein PIB30_035169 [Stylosanthes scabra]|uniref:Uncharacterized protein n=1 Tax=Stylosanthes scabra TaxID=79078 RepID=A0ABU6YBV3_9FABA|nr:hypothetical protein [Stylosanthes scabra]